MINLFLFSVPLLHRFRIFHLLCITSSTKSFGRLMSWSNAACNPNILFTLIKKYFWLDSSPLSSNKGLWAGVTPKVLCYIIGLMWYHWGSDAMQLRSHRLSRHRWCSKCTKVKALECSWKFWSRWVRASHTSESISNLKHHVWHLPGVAPAMNLNDMFAWYLIWFRCLVIL